MNAKRVVTAWATLALVFIVIGSFAALLYQQKNFSFTATENSPCRITLHSNMITYRAITIDKICTLAVLPALSVQAPSPAPVLATNSTRAQIYNFVSENPGVQFRGICAVLCLPIGLAEYHLGVLIKSGLVSFVRDGRYKRFFVANKFSRKDMLMISLLRHSRVKRIVEALINNGELSHGKLAGEVAITSQALTWQMKTLKNTKFVLQVNDGIKTIYSLDKNSASTLKRYLAVVG
ncbi:MAG: winged helix-turn-helix transcriptional regulator [Candidatus Bathyarchaeota archaeon]|nr:winged helix-turn-helix transcriptional regulator [Candidatus Bathyarchaeota archaeon]